MPKQRMPPEGFPRLFTVAECAAALNCSDAAVYALVESEELPSIRVGPNRGAIRVLEADLHSFIESRRSHPQDNSSRSNDAFKRLRL